jgi:hypothetical protein
VEPHLSFHQQHKQRLCSQQLLQYIAKATYACLDTRGEYFEKGTYLYTTKDIFFAMKT